jgi:hypothetical protein
MCQPPGIIRERSIMPLAPAARAASELRHDGGTIAARGPRFTVHSGGRERSLRV